MSTVSVTSFVLILVCGAVLGQEEAAYRVSFQSCDIDGDGTSEPCGTAGETMDGLRTWNVVVPVSAESIEVNLEVYLQSSIEPCVSSPTLCDGRENFVITDEYGIPTYGCNDDLDNNENGLVDNGTAEGNWEDADPDCRGVQAWSIALTTPSGFSVVSAGLDGTAGDLDSRGGYRDSSGNFGFTELAYPESNDGQTGVVSTVVLSHTNPVILPQRGEELVLRVRGNLDTTGVTLPGEMPPPSEFRLLGRESGGLVGSGSPDGPIKTVVSIRGHTESADHSNADIQLIGATASFVRGDSNDNATVLIDDVLYSLNWLFLNGPALHCLDAADANDNGVFDISDPVFTLLVLFVQGSEPSAFPAPHQACGEDSTADDLDCGAVSCLGP